MMKIFIFLLFLLGIIKLCMGITCAICIECNGTDDYNITHCKVCTSVMYLDEEDMREKWLAKMCDRECNDLPPLIYDLVEKYDGYCLSCSTDYCNYSRRIRSTWLLTFGIYVLNLIKQLINH